MITVSAAEFAVTVVKACLGAGVERGVAEEVGPACVELALRGAQSLTLLADALGNLIEAESRARWTRIENGWHADRVASLYDAVSMMDFAFIAGGEGARTGTNLLPAICTGLAFHRARHNRFTVDISFGEDGWLDAEANRDVFEHAGQNGPLALRFRQTDGAVERPDFSAIKVPKSDWQGLEFWTSKTLVPADETSRSDAGAGNTDND